VVVAAGSSVSTGVTSTDTLELLPVESVLAGVDDLLAPLPRLEA
jgi:hypothetical protein